MKISYRILLINFAIVVLILSSSALAFYSIMYEVLTSQQSKYLLNSANNLVYSLREVQQEWLDDLIYSNSEAGITENLTDNARFTPQNTDFIFADSDKSGRLNSITVNKAVVNLPDKSFRLQDFIIENPYTIVSTYENKKGTTFYFGKIISEEFLNFLSKRINAEVALIKKGTPVEISNYLNNQKHLQVLLDASAALGDKENYKIYSASEDSTDIIATTLKAGNGFGNEVQFMVFNSISEAAGLRSSIQTILIIIGSAGVVLSLILTFLFTDKIRKQITLLSKATKISKDGSFLNKINLKTKDELGQLAASFNEMIDELERNQKAKNDYSEFLTLLNQNPSLAEISDAALKKIIKSCGFTAGALYSVHNQEISLTSSFGTKSGISLKENNDLFYTAIKNKETFELTFDSDTPVISSGIYDITIKYLLIQPVIYNNKVIAILELAGTEPPATAVKEYLENIQDQLAIGLTNAGAFVQLENLVSELKLLNDEYQKQNMQIRKQNDTLTELHKKLKEKADELEVQKEKAEESAKLKSQFLAAVSHELRTPMNSVLGLTELILNDRSLEGKNKGRLEIVLKNGHRLMNLINDILDLSKIEAGKMEVYSEAIILDEIISVAESTISTLAAKKNLKFIIKKDTDTSVGINSDREKITQVIINLLDNAVKFTEKGSVTLRVFTEEDFIKFSVTDTGIGIYGDNLELIFNEFRQVDGSNARKYSGTGLGLAICKRIAALLEGYISVESKPGKGSVFTFAIPLKSIPESYKFEVSAASKKPVIVIDDDPEMRYTIGQYLVSKNYEVVFVENAAEAIEKARKVKPAAVTLNALLPENKSFELLNQFKSDPELNNVPLVLLSIFDNLGYAFSTYDYLINPLNEDKLTRVISEYEVLSKSKVGKVLIISGDPPEKDLLDMLMRKYSFLIHVITQTDSVFNGITEYQPDIILADLLMPGLDGFSLLQMIRSRRETRHIPLVVNVPEKLSDGQKESLISSIKEITIKSKGHPLDMLKVIRDRIDVQEYSFRKNIYNGYPENSSESDTASTEETFIGEVLIVDDDADTLFTINEIVKTCNCKTILANSGKECLEILKKQLPDLILLDIMMPELDGFQTLKRIKNNKNTEHIPVFAVTARAMAEDKEIILKHGFDDYISKPVNSGVIAFKIEKLFSKLKIA